MRGFFNLIKSNFTFRGLIPIHKMAIPKEIVAALSAKTISFDFVSTLFPDVAARSAATSNFSLGKNQNCFLPILNLID
ncbi:MAG: hypothetical protein DCE90_18475 [Pseudanabaena sp.]|nr:MAG: hypothetical protein DCE90_18475 [Pseudanabaena sp.]